MTVGDVVVVAYVYVFLFFFNYFNFVLDNAPSHSLSQALRTCRTKGRNELFRLLAECSPSVKRAASAAYW